MFLKQQATLFDLIPRRKVPLALAMTAGAAIIGGLGFSYTWMLGRVAGGDLAIASLDLAAKGSLGCWFSSLLLLAASATAVLVYLVRRHRTDDYQGRYRVWCWAAAFCFFVATDQAASLREAFRDTMVALTGTPLLADGSLWWVVAYTIALGALGSRLVVDMRPCWPALVALSAAAVAHALATAFQLNWISPPSGQKILLAAVCQMAGNLTLLMATLLFARHVILDAEGLLPSREREVDEEVEEEDVDETETGDQWKKIDSPHGTPQPVFQRVASAKPTFAAPSPAPLAPQINRKLTKGEKKALKERLLRERADRERRGL